jgi:uncharacterized LabA/DUF88 family protein
MKKPKAKVYIDGANLFYTQKHLGWTIDWKKAKQFLLGKFEVLEMRYYTGIKDQDEKMKNYLSYLRHVSIQTITKPLKVIKNQQGGVIYKSNCDVEMAVDILLDANSFDLAILFSGDSDFVYLIKTLQRRFQKQVYVFSSRRTISWEIKLTADKYWFLEDLKRKLKRKKTSARRRSTVKLVIL